MVHTLVQLYGSLDVTIYTHRGLKANLAAIIMCVDFKAQLKAIDINCVHSWCCLNYCARNDLFLDKFCAVVCGRISQELSIIIMCKVLQWVEVMSFASKSQWSNFLLEFTLNI